MMSMMGCRGVAADGETVQRVFETFRTQRHVPVTETVQVEEVQFSILISQPEVGARRRAGWYHNGRLNAPADIEATRWSLRIAPKVAEEEAGFDTELSEGIEIENFKSLYPYLQKLANEEMEAMMWEEDCACRASMRRIEQEQAARRAEVATASAYERKQAAEEYAADAAAREAQASTEREEAETAAEAARQRAATLSAALKAALQRSLQAGVQLEAAEAKEARAQVETDSAVAKEASELALRRQTHETVARLETEKLAAEESAKIATADQLAAEQRAKEEEAARDVAQAEFEAARAAEVEAATVFRCV